MHKFQYPRSLLAQLSEEIYQNDGVSAVLPQMLECLGKRVNLLLSSFSGLVECTRPSETKKFVNRF